jgi:phosphoribosylformimino-5-aminoimidazole carboxamide ribotide isomerase
VVDLDAAATGIPVHTGEIQRIVDTTTIPIEVGGGIRSLDVVEEYISLGVRWVIVGTAAVVNRDFVLEAAERFPDRIILGVDALDGFVKTEGWTHDADLYAADLVRSYRDAGIAAVIYTNIDRDGVGTGVDIDGTRKLARDGGVPTIASGGVNDIADIQNVREIADAGVIGVIAGRALYEGSLDLAEAIAVGKGKEISRC